MWDMALNTIKIANIILLLLLIVSCTKQPVGESTRELELYQNWELQPGDTIANHQVKGGLGDISISLDGDNIYAPIPGKVQRYKAGCVIFASDELPIYLFRLCGLNHPRIGLRRAGQIIGYGDELQLALLNKQPNGRWALVEPSKKIIEQMLQQ